MQLADVSRVLVVIGHIFLFCVAVIHLHVIGAKLEFPPSGVGFHEDWNGLGGMFRSLFCLAPSTLTVHWSPMVFALIGLLGQFERLRWDFVFSSFFRMAAFTIFFSVFACMGYSGGVGIIGAILNLVFAIVYIVTAFMGDGVASFNFPLPGLTAKTAPSS